MKTIGFRGLAYFQTHRYVVDLSEWPFDLSRSLVDVWNCVLVGTYRCMVNCELCSLTLGELGWMKLTSSARNITDWFQPVWIFRLDHIVSYCHWTAWLHSQDWIQLAPDCASLKQLWLVRACVDLWISGAWFVHGRHGRRGNFLQRARFGDSAVESALMLKALCDRLARVAGALVSLSSK